MTLPSPAGLQRVLLFRHELEAGEGIEALDAVGLRYLAGHFRGDDGLESHRDWRAALPERFMAPIR